MATVTLYREELEDNGLPPFCMRCGEPATLVKHKRFSWGPGWAVALLAVGALCFGPLFWVALILIPLLLKKMRVPVPLCERHRNHWLPLQIVLFGGIGVVVLLVCSTIVLVVTTSGPGEREAQLVGGLCLGTVAFLVAMLVPAAILQTRVIRPIEITYGSITLTSVANEFAQRVKQGRHKPRDVRPADDS